MLSTAKMTLKSDLRRIMKQGLPDSTPSEIEAQINDKADQIAEAINSFVSSIQITIVPGQIVTAGTPASQANANPVILSGPTNVQ